MKTEAGGRARVALLALVGLALAGLVLANLAAIAPGWLAGTQTPDEARRALLLVEYAFAPRLAVALLAGAALGLSGVVLQQVLQNPLAAGETLGVSAGAHLALTIGVLAVPMLEARHPEFFAVAGAFAAWGIICVIAWRRRGDPLTLILTGFIVNFVLGSIAMLLMMLNQEYLSSLFIWGAGSLAQGGWDDAWFLAIRLAIAAAIVTAMLRPLLILGFGDQAARNLGVSLRVAKPVLLATGIFVAASVVAAVGVIAFVGLAAPHIARLAGAQRLGQRALAAPLVGAALVLFVDQGVQFIAADDSGILPTGAITALLGGPLMIWLLGRIPEIGLEGIGTTGNVLPGWHSAALGPADVKHRHAAIVAALAVAVAVAVLVGRGPHGFTFGFDFTSAVFDLRMPRVAAAAFAGLAISVAGCLVQRLFANPMASPEILGIGGGVAAGLVTVLIMSPAAGFAAQFLGSVGGAIAVTALVLAVGAGRAFSPVRLLLIGIAITALLDAAVLVFLALGDPRAGQVLAWLSGSTYRVTWDVAILVGVLALAGLVASLPLRRWLDILPLGTAVAGSLGVPTNAVRVAVLVIASLTTAAAALVIGPMSFVGLLAPHCATLLGLRRAGSQILGSALIGAALVVGADWVGRVVFAPTELPAGILAVLIGAMAVIFFLVSRRGSGTSARERA